MHLDRPFHRYVTHDLKGVPDIYSFSFHCEVYQHLVYSEEFNDIRTEQIRSMIIVSDLEIRYTK